MRGSGGISTSGQKSDVIIVLRDLDLVQSGLLRDFGRLGAVLGICSLRMRRNGVISTSGQKYDVASVSGDPDFY